MCGFRKMKKIDLLTAFIMFVVLAASFSWGLQQKKVEIVRTMKVKEATDWGILTGETAAMRGVQNITFYNTLDESLEAFAGSEVGARKYLPEDYQEIIRFQEDIYIFSIWAGMQWANEPYLYSFLFKMKEEDNKISYPLYTWPQSMVGLWDSEPIYEDRDRVVRDIVMSYFFREATAIANNGASIYYGVGLDEGIKNLHILGQAPDEIIRLEFGGKEYYFWYYKDGTAFTEKFEAGNHLGEITMEEMAGYFQVSLEGKETGK